MRRILDAGASPFSYLLSAFAVCLGRVHQADEVVFGVPFLNRRTEDERSVVGQFANNLPVRVPVAEELPLVELAERVRRQIDRLREHERLPYGEILREAPVQDADSRRLFDVTASYLRFPRPPATPGVDRTTTIMAPVHAADALSVMVQAFDDEPGLRVDLDYADDVFDGHLTAEALAGHVGELLRRGLDFPGTPLGELGMLTDDEYEDVVRRHQGAPAPYAREKTLHELFAEQAARTPGQTAVVDGASGATLTFAELDRRADQVARALSERGAGPGDRVAILAERGLELLPGLLGILKAGAAYVPVDPGYPPSRVRLLLEDCGAKLVLRGAREVEVPSTGAPVLRISELYRGDGRPLGRTAGPRDVAYTIYTSGSTGRPKGVMVEHHAVVNRLTWMQRRYPSVRATRCCRRRPSPSTYPSGSCSGGPSRGPQWCSSRPARRRTRSGSRARCATTGSAWSTSCPRCSARSSTCWRTIRSGRPGRARCATSSAAGRPCPRSAPRSSTGSSTATTRPAWSTSTAPPKPRST